MKCWRVTCDGLASHPGGVAILLVAHATETGISSGSYASQAFFSQIKTTSANAKTVSSKKPTTDTKSVYEPSGPSGRSLSRFL